MYYTVLIFGILVLCKIVTLIIARFNRKQLENEWDQVMASIVMVGIIYALCSLNGEWLASILIAPFLLVFIASVLKRIIQSLFAKLRKS